MCVQVQRRGSHGEVNFNKINWSQNNKANGFLVRSNPIKWLFLKCHKQNAKFDIEVNLFLELRTHTTYVLWKVLSRIDFWKQLSSREFVAPLKWPSVYFIAYWRHLSLQLPWNLCPLSGKSHYILLKFKTSTLIREKINKTHAHAHVCEIHILISRFIE